MRINIRSRVQAIAGVILSTITALIFFNYTSGLKNEYAIQSDTSNAYFVVREIPEGTKLEDVITLGFVESREVLTKSLPVEVVSTTIQASLGTLFSNRDIPEGQILLQTDFGPIQVSSSGLLIPGGNIVVSIRLQDIERISPFLRPGNDVAIFATGSTNSQSGATATGAIVPIARVVGIGDTRYIGGQEFLATGDSSIVTLAIDPTYAAVLIQASRSHTLQLALLSKDALIPNGFVTQKQILGSQ